MMASRSPAQAYARGFFLARGSVRSNKKTAGIGRRGKMLVCAELRSFSLKHGQHHKLLVATVAARDSSAALRLCRARLYCVPHRGRAALPGGPNWRGLATQQQRQSDGPKWRQFAIFEPLGGGNIGL